MDGQYHANGQLNVFVWKAKLAKHGDYYCLAVAAGGLVLFYNNNFHSGILRIMTTKTLEASYL
jgi:hypothetical protein